LHNYAFSIPEHPADHVQTVAGIIALLNDFMIFEGKKPLGFLNPFLYSDGIDGLNDIKSGSNPGCDTDGFTAIPGWDAVRDSGRPTLHSQVWLTFRFDR